MNFGEGFVDLRVQGSQQGGHSDDSVWPSFTDIMTVVVMIFLMALVVILIRNVELVQQLRSTMEAERQAAEIARSTAQQKENLVSQMGLLEKQLYQLQTQLSQTREERDEKAGNLALQLERITALARSSAAQKENMIHQMSTLEQQLTELRLRLLKSDEERATQQQELARRSRELSSLQMNLSQSQQENTQLQQNIETLNEQEINAQLLLRETNRQLADRLQELQQQRLLQDGMKSRNQELQQRYVLAQESNELLGQNLEAKGRELNIQREELTARRNQMQSLEGSYSELKNKYDRLVRPARSSIGRYIIEIRFYKDQGNFVIQTREPGEPEYNLNSRVSLNQRLLSLRDKYKDKLYTKIIIPENSDLSYNEAWSFTNDILNKYDYYYRQ